MKQKFKNFLSRFSYRSRFTFWVVIVFLVVPVPLYWILKTQHFFSSSATIQLKGNKEARLWFHVFDAVMNNYLEWGCRLATGEKRDDELITLSRAVKESFDYLKTHLMTSEKEILIKKGFFQSGNVIKDRRQDLVFLDEILEVISHQNNLKNIEDHAFLYWETLQKLAYKIQQLAYDFHIVLQTNRPTQVLAETIYFSLIQDQILLVTLNQQIANLHLNPESQQDTVIQIIATLDTYKYNFENTQSSFKNAYQKVQDRSIWNQFSYQEAQEHLMACSQLNARLIERTRSNLLSVGESQPWPGSNSLFNKNADCMQKGRRIALTVFEEILQKERNYYLWQQAIVIIAVLIFVFLMIIFLIFRFLTVHFIQMYGYIKGLSKGNFANIMFTNPHEEMGQIALAFQKMGKTIEEVVNQLNVLGFGLAASSQKIEATANEQTFALAIQQSCLKNIDNNIQEISSNARELAEAMNNFTQISKERLEKDVSHVGLKHLQEKMVFLKIGSQNILDVFSHVHEKGLSTRKLTTHMTKISDQTSLLALNAAIEALNFDGHHAFDEITENIQHFSKTTSSSTQAIQKNVNEMSQSVALGKVIMESCIKEITMGANRLIGVSYQLETISLQDAIQHDKFHIVNATMQEQAKRSEEMSQSLKALNEISAENSRSVEMLYHTLSELCTSSEELHSVLHTLFSKEGA